MMPKKNPYLVQHKENISSQQKLIRQRLGKSTEDNNFEPLPRPPPPRPDDDLKIYRLQTSMRNLPALDNNEDFPSIDDFDHDAEESLQFFKKNLLPTTGQSTPRTTTNTTQRQPLVSGPRPKSLAASGGSNSSHQYQQKPTLSTGLFDRQPSLSSIKGGESAYVARSRKPLDSKNMTMPKSMPSVKQKLTPVNAEQASLQRVTRPKLPMASGAATDELELTRAGLPEMARPKGDIPIGPPQPRLPESPIPAETFARKGLNNSLLRAHDSIRLKVNRPKVRPQSSSGEHRADSHAQAGDLLPPRVEDTELDDTIELAEIRQPDASGGTRTPTSLMNERAVDVKRRSSKKGKGSKKKSKEGNMANKDDDDESHKIPVRNFSEVRVVKVVRSEDERSLGVSVEVDAGNIVVARVFAGGLADKQGALQVGDIILAVNNREVYTPEQMQEQLRQSIMDDTVLLKIVPSFREELPTLCIYLRALFDYDPNEDTLSPCKVKGVAFNRGDILEVINQSDDNYWQARRVDSDNLETGLIPSQELEERRRAFVLPDYDLATKFSMCGTKVSRKSGEKIFYNVGQNCDFDKADMQLYEEVCRTPAFERRTLVLIGANGVGKQALKARLIQTDPERFGSPLPHTSRLPRDGEEDGVHYHFVTREMMEEDIISGKYLEYGEYDGALYGTKLDSVREIIGSSRVCVLDCSPTCLKVLKTSDYLPFVAFIAAPTLDQLRYMNEFNRNGGQKTYATFDRALSRQSRRAKTLQDFAFDFFEDEDLQLTVEESALLFRSYENYFDIVLVNNDFSRTFEQLRDAIDALSQAPQWIPISWIYGT